MAKIDITITYYVIYYFYPLLQNLIQYITLKIFQSLFSKTLFLLKAILFFCTSFVFFTSCAPENRSFVGRIWHNTNSHYNAYYLAREKMKETEDQVFKDRRDNYTQLLDVIPPLDSINAIPYKGGTEYVIKKASKAIQYHRYSKWTDDNFLLIGKARLYQVDFRNALETFKYVNSQSTDEAARHKAMIGLLHIFIWQKDYEKARSAIGYIRKEKLDKRNTVDFYLTRAQLYKELDDYSKTAAAIKLSLRLMKRGEKKARSYFILGQLYELLGRTKDSYKSYKTALTYTPQFELDFNIRLNLIEVYQIKNEKDSKRFITLLSRMLKDEKNKDYKDQVYYKMGNYEYNQKHYDKSIEYLKKSVASSKSNIVQKSLSYLKLGEIYYENLQKYEMASAYYDSTLNGLPKYLKKYPQITRRQKILRDFTEQTKIVRLEDSLQNLATLEPYELNKILDNIIDKEEARFKKDKKDKEERNNKNSNTEKIDAFSNLDPSNTRPKDDGSETWYFYNSKALSVGNSEFLRRWGNRPLEDNWRRSFKVASINPINTDTVKVADIEKIKENLTRQSQDQKEKTDLEAKRKKRKDEIKSNIPFEPEKLKASNKKVESAMYRLGKIYDLDLEEDTNAIKAYEKFVTRFSGSEFEPEILYSLFLLYKKLGNNVGLESARERLNKNYPQTDFAKLANNANYTQEGNINDKHVEEVYNNIYQMFLAEQFEQAEKEINQVVKEYPDSRFTEKIRILQIYIIAKTQELPNYRIAIQKFLKDFPKSENQDYLKKLLVASAQYNEKPVDKKK